MRKWISLSLLLGFQIACAAPRLHVPPTSASRPSLDELWQEPNDLSSRNLFYGIGGPELAPKPEARFEFTKEDATGASPGYSARSEDGTKWDIKMGAEVQPEVVVSRLLWAIGYHQPPTYY